jgi:hypothetical protein
MVMTLPFPDKEKHLSVGIFGNFSDKMRTEKCPETAFGPGICIRDSFA